MAGFATPIWDGMLARRAQQSPHAGEIFGDGGNLERRHLLRDFLHHGVVVGALAGVELLELRFEISRMSAGDDIPGALEVRRLRGLISAGRRREPAELLTRAADP